MKESIKGWLARDNDDEKYVYFYSKKPTMHNDIYSSDGTFYQTYKNHSLKPGEIKEATLKIES